MYSEQSAGRRRSKHAGDPDRPEVCHRSSCGLHQAEAEFPWVVITSGSATGGDGTLTYSVASNNGAARVARITVGNQVHTISQAQAPPPSNDAFAAASLMFGPSGSVTGGNFGATLESGEPPHAGSAGGASVRWSWEASASGPVVMSTEGSDFNTLLAVYRGSSVSALAAVAANNDTSGGTTSYLSFNATRGAVYRIAVDGVSGQTGEIRLHWNVVRLPAAWYDAQQQLSIFSAGPGFQVLFYNYDTGALSVSPFHALSARVPYPQGPAEWIGLFLYDYGTGGYTQALYRTHQGI